MSVTLDAELRNLIRLTRDRKVRADEIEGQRCLHCLGPLPARDPQVGGRQYRFCSSKCRRRYWDLITRGRMERVA